MNPPRAFWTTEGGRACDFFGDDERLRLCVGNIDDAGAVVELVLSGRHARGLWTPWRTLRSHRAFSGGAGGMFTAPWSLADTGQDDRWAFADFRFDAWVRRDGQTRRVRSDVVRHYARVVGFYGFGPIGERWSNADIRRVAREAGGAVIRARDPVTLRRLAACVPPGEPCMRLYGYSLGGRAAVRWARELERRGVGVELLVGIDPVDLLAGALAVPPNVRRAVSFYQRNGARTPLLPGPAGRGLPFIAANPDTAVENRRLDEWTVGSRSLPVMHEDMPRALKTELTRLLLAGA